MNQDSYGSHRSRQINAALEHDRSPTEHVGICSKWNFFYINPFSAMGDFRHHIIVHLTYLGVNLSFDILSEMQ